MKEKYKYYNLVPIIHLFLSEAKEEITTKDGITNTPSGVISAVENWSPAKIVRFFFLRLWSENERSISSHK
jgi:hypothetical protein